MELAIRRCGTWAILDFAIWQKWSWQIGDVELGQLWPLQFGKVELLQNRRVCKSFWGKFAKLSQKWGNKTLIGMVTMQDMFF